MGFMLKLMLQNVPHLWNIKILPTCIIFIHFSYTFFFPLINALVYCYIDQGMNICMCFSIPKTA